MTAVDKIDSNVTGLSIAREASPGVLPGSPIWVALQPNDYGDFGAALSTTARNPISQLRQRRKGVTTDLDANGGFSQDLSFYSFQDLWPGLMLAERKSLPSFGGINSAQQVDSVSGTVIDFGTAAAALGFVVGMIIHTEGFGVATNNTGATPRAITAVSGDTIALPSLATEASPPKAAFVQCVGFVFDQDDATITRPASDYPRLVVSAADLTDFGLEPGDWVKIGGATTGSQFSAAADNTFARVGQAVTATTMIFDLTTGGATGAAEMVANAGTGKDIEIYFSNVVRNVPANDTEAAEVTYHIERSLGEADDSNGEIQGEVLEGALLNNATIEIPTADKIAIELEFLGRTVTNYSGATGFELPTDGATVNELRTADVYNTTDNIPDIRIFTRSADPAAIVPASFFGYVSELSIAVSNNATPNKAVGTLGAFAVTAGNFTATAEMTAYFQSVAALQAVRSNADVGLFALTQSLVGARTAGILIDLPFGSVATSGLNVATDEAITAPLTLESSVDPTSNRTMSICEFWFLP